jgi:hypothetical protein
VVVFSPLLDPRAFSAVTDLRQRGFPVLRWPGGTELDSVLAPLRRPPPGLRRLAARS